MSVIKQSNIKELLSLINIFNDYQNPGLPTTPSILPVNNTRERIYEEIKPVLESFSNLADKWHFTINKYVETEERLRSLKNKYDKLEDKYYDLNESYKKLQNTVISLLTDIMTDNDKKMEVDI